MLRVRGLALPCLLIGLVTFGPAQSQSSSPRPFETKLIDEQVEVSSQGLATETVHVQIKANNAAAAQKIGQQPILYSEALSDLDIVEASTLKADGRKLPVAKSAIYTQLPQGAPQTPMFDDLRQKVVVFPDVEAGDSIDLTFRRVGKQAQMPGQFSYDQAFTRLATFDDVDVTIRAPKSYPLTTEAHEVQFDRHDDGARTVYHWHYAGIATIETDSSPLSAFDRSPRLVASSLKDYDALGHTLYRLVAPEEKVTPKIQALADQQTGGVADRRQQAQRLYEWVSRHIRYVGIEIGAGTIVPHDAETVLANGYGDCKDHVVLYSALLKAKGIASDFVAINLGNAYALPATAVLGELNHVITWLPEFGIYADTTAGVAPFGTLPFQEYGKPVVHAIAGANALRRVPLLPPGLASVATSTAAKIDESGRVTGSSTITAGGPFSLLLRQIGLGIEAVGPDTAAQALMKQANLEGTAGFTLMPPSELAPTYKLVSTWSFGPFPEIAQGQRFAMPIGLAVLGLPGDFLVGSLTQDKANATEPVPCFSGHAEEDISLEPPLGRHFLSPPPDANIRSAHISFSARWSLTGVTLHLHRQFTSIVDTAICSGPIRTELASDLVAIRQTYAYGAALAPQSAGRPVAALDATQVALLNDGVVDQATSRGTEMRAPSSSDVPENLVAALATPNEKPKYGGVAPSGTAVAWLEDRRPIAPTEHGPANSAQGANERLAVVYDRRGLAHDSQGRFDDAVADFSKALSLSNQGNEASRYYAERALSYWLARDWRPALRDFSAAIARDDGNADAHLGRGRSEYFAGRVTESIADFDKTLALRKDDASAALWLFIAESRAGRNARADLAARTTAWDMGAWPGSLLRLFRGDGASTTPAPADAHQRCAQEFYLGELALSDGDRNQALAHFQAARNADLPGQVEFVAAGLELARLK